MESAVKKKLFDYAIFLSIVTIFCAILVFLTIFNRKPLQKGLAKSVKYVLEEKFPGEFILESNVQINSMTALKCAIFELQPVDLKKCDLDFYAIILRVQTFFGPKPAVFLYDGVKNDAIFVGFSAFQGKIAPALSISQNDCRMIFEKNRILKIIKDVQKSRKKIPTEEL